jgi:hypothetical protein
MIYGLSGGFPVDRGLYSTKYMTHAFTYGLRLTRAEPTRFLTGQGQRREMNYLHGSRGHERRRYGHRLSQPRPSHPLVKFERRQRQSLQS